MLLFKDQRIFGDIPWHVTKNKKMSIFKGVTGNKQMKEECTRAWDYLQKTSGFPLNAEIIKQTHKIMMDGKNILVGEYRKSPTFVKHYYRIFPPADTIGRLVDDALHGYYNPTSRDPILAAANLFADLIRIHPFGDGNGRLCRMILSHVLIQDGYYAFPVLLGLFNNRERQHYIQAVNRYHENPSMFYTVIKSYCCEIS